MRSKLITTATVNIGQVAFANLFFCAEHLTHTTHLTPMTAPRRGDLSCSRVMVSVVCVYGRGWGEMRF